MADAAQSYDVAIVGYGPVGALLANLLGRAGLRVVVLERETEIYPLPRAVHFDGEVMRIFQAAGLAEAMARVTRTSAQGTRYMNAAGQVLLIRRGVEGEGPQGWAGNWYFHQPNLETVLRQGAARFPHVDIRLGCAVARIEERAAGVRLELADGASLAARYVVGCDGARSLVRATIGSTSLDLGLHQPWLVVDVLVDPASPRVAKLPEYSIQFCNPARPMTVVNVGGRRRRWEIMLMPGDDPEALIRPENFWPLLARWLDPADGEIERSAVYTFHSVIAEGWRRGRLLLAGDSCHQTPPFLGQGMCAGMRDAANLAWKLARVARGRWPDSLLDTYESERRPHVHAFIDLAVQLGGIIQATDPDVAADRDRRFAESGPETFDYPAPQLGPGMRTAGPAPVGTIFPQPRLADGTRLDERIGDRFALIAAPALWPEGADADLALIDPAGSALGDWLDRAEARAVLLRPDRYIAGLARNADELARMLRLLPPA